MSLFSEVHLIAYKLPTLSSMISSIMPEHSSSWNTDKLNVHQVPFVSTYPQKKVKWCVTMYGDPYSEFESEKWKWRDMWPSMVTHTRNLCSAFNPSKCTNTAVNTHTHREHTPRAVGSQCCGTQGAAGGSVPCSRAPQSWYWRWRERWTFTPPPTIPAGPETRTCDLRVTNPTLYPSGHDCPLKNILNKTRLPYSYKQLLKCGNFRLPGVITFAPLQWKVKTFYVTTAEDAGRYTQKVNC